MSGKFTWWKKLKTIGGRNHTEAGKRIVDAVRSNNVAKLEQLLASVPADSSDKALQRALQYGLVVAIQKPELAKCFDILLKAGAQPISLTGVVSAAELGNVEALRSLLQAGCDANQKGIDGSTALHAAVAKKHHDCVQMLMSHKADPTARNNVFTSPLMMAVQGNDHANLRTMLEGHPDAKNHRDMDGQTLLHVACKKGQEEIVRLLLELGCDPNVTDINYHTPLISALLHHHIGIVECLVDKCNVDFPGQRKATALIYAAQTNEFKGVSVLLSAGAAVNEQDVMGNTALIAGGPYCQVLQILLDFGANPNIQNHFGMTALWYAAYYHYADAVEILLKANSNAELKGAVEDEFHTSPLEIALKRGHFMISKIIIYAGFCHLKLSNFIQATNLPPVYRNSEQGKDLIEWMRKWTSTPRSLMYLCRRSIRQNLGNTHTVSKIHSLPLPESLLTYVDLTHLIEEVEAN